MKKFIFMPLFLFLIVSCQEEHFTEPVIVDQKSLNGAFEAASAPKINICHYDDETGTYQIISVSENAWNGHANHGDVRLDDQDGDGYLPENNCIFSEEVDCDDTNPDVNPGAVEVCDNGIDDDCDGAVDGDDDDCNTSCVEGEIELQIDPDRVANTGDEYTIYVHPTDNSTGTPWGPRFDDIDALTNYTNIDQANMDFSGQDNTSLIVAELGAYNEGNYAASICAQLAASTGCDWYLPSKGELQAIYDIQGPAPTNNFGAGNYWSSTEAAIVVAYFQGFANNNQGASLKDQLQRCRCIRK